MSRQLNPEYKTDTSMNANDAIKMIQIGHQIFKEIDAAEGRNVNYHEREIIPYTWDDFTNLVMYEKANELPHNYSAMVAINLMKKKIRNKSLKFLDGSEEFKNQCIGETTERIHEFYDELYLNFLKKIKTWDISTGVYFDQYVKWDIQEIAEYVGNFDIYGTGRSVRNEHKKEKVAFPYTEHMLEPVRKSPTQYSHDFQYTPPMNCRPLDALYIFTHEQSDNPDNPYLQVEEVNDFIRSMVKKIDSRDISVLTKAEKTALQKAVLYKYKQKQMEQTLNCYERKELNKKVKSAFAKVDKAFEKTEVAPPMTTIPGMREKQTNEIQVSCYLYAKQGLSIEEIAQKTKKSEKNIKAYINAVKRYIEHMSMEAANIPPERALWYLCVTGTLPAATVNTLVRLDCKSIDDVKNVSVSTLNHFRAINEEKINRLKEVCAAFDVQMKQPSKEESQETIKSEPRSEDADLEENEDEYELD